MTIFTPEKYDDEVIKVVISILYSKSYNLSGSVSLINSVEV
jgi:hypothetical protein